jgi:uncharacterized protein
VRKKQLVQEQQQIQEKRQMKILADRLTASPTRIDFEASPAWWREQSAEGRELEYAVEDPLRVEVEAYVVNEDILLKGSLSGAIRVECSRCLQRYRHALSEHFRLVLESAGERSPADPEGAIALARDGMCLGDGLEVGWYRGSEIVLDAFFSELISLALPLQPLCAEDCLGLCARCGADRNRVDCGCEEMKPPSPFAVLAALRDGESGGES